MVSKGHNFSTHGLSIVAGKTADQQPLDTLCFMITASGGMKKFELKVTDHEVFILSLRDKRVMATLKLEQIHPKLAQKQKQDLPDHAADADNTNVAEKFWYPIKLTIGNSKVRSLFFESEQEA